MNDKQKATRVREMSTESLRAILDKTGDREGTQPTPELPLAGLIHLNGIGQVPVTMLRNELNRREATTKENV